MLRANPQKRPKLAFQHVGILEQEANPALSERWVARLWQREIRELLVATHVEQAQHDLARMDALGGARPELILLLLGGKRAADRKCELRAIEADSVSSVQAGRLGVRNLAGVREQGHRGAVERD